MENRSQHPLSRFLRRLSSGRAGDAALDDVQLLNRIRTQRDESAFTTLVQRYGAMVWSICVRRLGETPEAEDAFQATYLVLVRKAGSLRDPQSLGPWLYGVAYRTASKLRVQRTRRAAREPPLTEQIAEERGEPMWSELRPVLDEEINRLPTKYRLPVLLCYLQGLSSEEAAERLGCAKGTVFSRLSRARDLLRRGLVRRGVEVSAGALAALLAENTALRAMPPFALREITIHTSLVFAAGTAGQSLSAPLAALVEGVVRSMFLGKVKFAAIVILALGLVGSGVGSLAHKSQADPPLSPALSVKEENVRRDPPAPDPNMVAAPALAKRKPPVAVNNQNNPRTRQVELRDLLSRSVDYPGLEDPRATLTDVLDQLSKRYNLTFHLNSNAFRSIDPKIEMPTFKIAETPIGEMHCSLKTVLQTILERLPPRTRPMFVIRKDYIQITTESAVRSELGIPANRPLLPLVGDTLDNIPISEALRRLMDQSGYSVVSDPRVAEKLKTPVSAELNDVPVDTAVRMLANMAGLSVARLDNALYVTTVENAKHLNEEQAKINVDTTTKNATIGDMRIIRVNAGLLKDKGDLEWPQVLQREEYNQPRENLNVLMKAAYKGLVEGEAPSDTNLQDLRSNLRKIQDTLRANVGQLTPDEYFAADRYLRYVEKTITALKDTNDVQPKKSASANSAK
jgi:RNA polymerase sigma factor (sigma-70 family)